MNNDLISRSALIKWIDDSVSQYGHIYSTDMLNMWGLFKDYLINNVPTVTPDKIQTLVSDYLVYRCEPERPQGEWIETNSNDENIICPFCKTEFNGDIKLICGGENPNFCPECGADMRKGESE